MYTVAVRKEFVARHFLVGGDWGPESEPHSHGYVVELRLGGDELDANGYLVDIVEIERAMETQTNYFRDRLLNELPEFAGLNPSIEHFSRIFLKRLAASANMETLAFARVTIWENRIAYASYEEPLR